MDAVGFARATAFNPPETQSPTQREKDDSVAIARRVLQNDSGVTRSEAQVLARQLLRALALPA